MQIVFLLVLSGSTPVVLNRRSVLAFLPVRNTLFEFYSLGRPYVFKSRTMSEEYSQ